MLQRSLVAMVSFLLGCSACLAQSTWINPLSGDWSGAANWDPVGVPVSGATTQLTFNSLFAGAYTATNNTGTNPFQLQLLMLNSQSGGGVTITNAAGNALEFVSGSTITQMGAGGFTIGGTTVNLLGSTLLNGGGSGALTFSSQITGAGSLNINRTTTNYLGLTAFTSATANSYSGGTTLTRGILSVSLATNLGSGPLTIATTGVGLLGSGELRTSAATQTFNLPIVITSGATLNVSTGNTYAIGSAVTGAGGFNVGNYILANNITLEGANTFAGDTSAQFGTIVLRGTNGALASTNISLFRNSSLTLDSTAATTGTGNAAGNQTTQNRISDSAVVNLNRTNFTLTGNATTSTTETIGTLNNSGWGVYVVNATATAGTTLTITDLNRVNGGTFEFRGGNLGLNAPGTANTANVLLGNIDGSPINFYINGTPGTPSLGTFRFMTGGAAGSEGFLTYNSTNGLRLLNTASEYATTLPITDYKSFAAGNNNVRPTTPLVAFGGFGGRTAAQTLAIAGANSGVYGFGGLTGQLFVNSGAILNVTSTGYLGVETLLFGNSEAAGDVFVTAGGTLIIDSRITNAANFHVAGGNRVSLNNVENDIDGDIILNFGTLQFNTESQLGNPIRIQFNGGFLDAGNLATGAPDTLTTPLDFGPAGGIIRLKPLGNNANATSSSMILSGPITGAGPFQINSNGVRGISGGGTLVLTGDATAYSGLVIIDGGVVQIDSGARLGTNAFLSLGSTSLVVPATLAVTATTATAKNIMVNGLAQFDVAAGATFTINGFITGTQALAAITKRGPGELVLTREATHGGPTNVGDTSLNLSAVGGTLRLVNQGAILNSNAFTINPGSTLIVDNTGTANLDNRLNAAPVNMAGGTLQLLGSAAAASREIVGQLTLVGPAGSIIEVVPGSGQTAALFFSGTTNGGLVVGVGSTATLRGIGLGTTSQINIVDQTASPAGPQIINGMVPHLFGEDGSSVGLITFNTVSATATFPQFYSARLLTAGEYVLNAFPDASVTTTNHQLTTPAAPTGSSTVNALFINTGGSLTIGAGNTTTLNSGTLILAGSTSVSGGTLARAASGSMSIYVGTGTATFGSALNTGGAGNTLAKAGPGMLELTASLGATNAPTIISISRGTLRLGAGGAIPAATVVNAAAGATFDVNGTGIAVDVGAVNGLGTLQLGSTAGTVLRIGTGNATSQFGGTITGTGSLEKIGTGTLRFTASSVYAGPITLTAGTVAFGNAAVDSQRFAIASGGAITAADGTTIVFGNVDDLARPINANVGAAVGTVTLSNGGGFGTNTRISGDILIGANKTLAFGGSTSGFQRISGNISGAGNLTMISVVNAIVDGTNTYTGTTTITTATPSFVGVGSDTAFGSGGLLTLNASNLLAVDGNRTISNPVSLAGNVTFGTSLSIYQGDNLTFTGNASMTAARTFLTTATGRITFTNLAGAFAITKTGGGSLALQGTNISYTGTTTVTNGTLLANGNFAAGGGAVTVSTGAALGGTGIINRAVSISGGGIIAPGESAGNLTVNGNLGLPATSIYYWELAANTTAGPGVNFDRISMTSGDLTVAAGAIFVPSFFDGSGGPSAIPFWAVNQRWNNVIDLSGTATNTTLGTAFTIDNATWMLLGNFSTTPAMVGSGIDLIWVAAVPEPALLGLLAPLLLLRARRRS